MQCKLQIVGEFAPRRLKLTWTQANTNSDIDASVYYMTCIGCSDVDGEGEDKDEDKNKDKDKDEEKDEDQDEDKDKTKDRDEDQDKDKDARQN